MVAATTLFAGSSALSKWLVATYPISEMLFVRAAAALVGSSLVILPATGLGVFRTKRLRDHMLRGISQSCAQTFLVIAFSVMPLASAVAINSSAPLIATVASIVFLKETVGPARWGALSVGFLGVLLIASPGVDTFQAGSLFAVANAILFGTVTVGARSMTATESAETSIMYQMVFLTAFFTAVLPFGWVTPTLRGWGAMVVNGLGNALGQYLSTRALHPHLGGGAAQLLLARVGDHIGISGVGRHAVSRLAGGFRDQREKTGWLGVLNPRQFSVHGRAPRSPLGPGSRTIGASPYRSILIPKFVSFYACAARVRR